MRALLNSFMSVFVALCQKCYSEDLEYDSKTKEYKCKKCGHKGKPFDASDDDRKMKEYLADKKNKK